jgi:hypothetical protein
MRCPLRHAARAFFSSLVNLDGDNAGENCDEAKFAAKLAQSPAVTLPSELAYRRTEECTKSCPAIDKTKTILYNIVFFAFGENLNLFFF